VTRLLGAAGLVLLASSCGAAEPDQSVAPANAEKSAVNPLGRARCQAPSGVSASPRNTQEALALLNALPKPTTVPCFVESLARPLSIQATNSIFSAQPALSTESPRVFIKLGPMWISVVVAGDSSSLIEFGDLLADDPSHSIKGELELPLSAPAAPSAPYERVMFGQGTSCGLCHYNERHADGSPFPNAFASITFRPRPESYVAIQSLRAEAEACNWETEAKRCDMLSALFNGGEVIEEPFPSTMPTFF
jgi:hypothetical protein